MADSWIYPAGNVEGVRIQGPGGGRGPRGGGGAAESEPNRQAKPNPSGMGWPLGRARPGGGGKFDLFFGGVRVNFPGAREVEKVSCFIV
jgi:hypothetical protein